MLRTLFTVRRSKRQPSVESRVLEHLTSMVNEARQKGEAKLQIQVGEITKVLDLSHSSQSGRVARVLESKQFHEAGGLTLYYRSGPRHGSHTLYYFDLTADLKPLDLEESSARARGLRVGPDFLNRLAIAVAILGLAILLGAAAWLLLGS